MASRTPTDETMPLLRPMSQASVGKLCIFAVAGGLTASWCLIDGWNRDVSSQLFGLAEVDQAQLRKDGMVDLHHFSAPLLLAFLQFIFMGVLFSALFYFLVPTAATDLAEVRQAGGLRTWATVIVTHVFSLFWLQALMMPQQPMSLGLWAASRSLEVPIAAGIRAKVFDTKPSARDAATPVLMFAAAWLLFYSYSQLSQCLCMWNGYGVELKGMPLILVYLLVLIIPPANFVAQESVMTHGRVRPLLLLAVTNLGAAVMTFPLLFLAHVFGMEDQRAAWSLIVTHPEMYMLVLWLCVQMAATTSIATGLIYSVNSFWAVALRSLRVVFWWCRVLVIFYFTSGADLLSTSLPNESFWSFIMFCGICFMIAAICTETVSQSLSLSESISKPAHSPLSAQTAAPAAPANTASV